MKINKLMRTATTMLLCIAILCACTKEGPAGERGERGAQGERGERGEKGEKGEKGADGSKILSGTGAPATTLGAEGDFYFDTAARAIYGPKTTTGWGTATILSGADGTDGADGVNGADGSQIFSGAGSPATTLGKVGDFYFDTTERAIYGPKTAAGWGTATSLAGEQGIPGNAGVKMYTYGSRTFTSNTSYSIPITPAEIANSLIYAYFQEGASVLYSVPCYVSNTYEVRSYLAPQAEECFFFISLYIPFTNNAYTTPVIWETFKIIVVPIPEGNIITKSVTKEFSSYAELAEYYGLPQ